MNTRDQELINENIALREVITDLKERNSEELNTRKGQMRGEISSLRHRLDQLEKAIQEEDWDHYCMHAFIEGNFAQSAAKLSTLVTQQYLQAENAREIKDRQRVHEV
jgi:predicted nuclease with TOPRIM domain